MAIGKCNGIILSTIKYAENSIIVKCITDEWGIQSYIINNFRSKSSPIKPSQLLPLTLVELECYHQPHKSIHRIKELKCNPMLNQLHFDVIKISIGSFMAELISRCIKAENQIDENLFSFLSNSIQILDIETNPLANFPAYFSIQLTKYIGFSPRYDLLNLTAQSLHLGNENHFNLLFQSSFENYHQIVLNKSERNVLLESILDYYAVHSPEFGKLKSLPILKTLFE